MDLTVARYASTKGFPQENRFGLTSRLRRASASISAKVAEGQGRRSEREFVRFPFIAGGSLLENDTHLELALRLDYIEAENYPGLQERVNQVGRLLNGLIRALSPDL
jgi:four helix bundle protein